MEQKHTAGLAQATPFELYVGETSIANCCHERNAGLSLEEKQANAERLTACWNALADLNPEGVKALVEAAKEAADLLGALAKTLKYQRTGHEFWPNREEADARIADLRAALAKIEEKV